MTPLSLQLQSFLKYLNEGKLSEIDPTRLRRMLETALSQVDRLGRLIRELVDVSRISAGKLALVPEDIDLLEVTRTVLEAFRGQIHELGCELRFEGRGPIRGCWDRTRIEQVLINLLTNALKYGLGKPVELHLRESAGFAIILIRDHGIGIASEDLQRIFERFERAVPAQNFGGLGLGLFITREIVKMHHGTINVSSQLHVGSAFEIKLPLAPPYARSH